MQRFAVIYRFVLGVVILREVRVRCTLCVAVRVVVCVAVCVAVCAAVCVAVPQSFTDSSLWYSDGYA